MKEKLFDSEAKVMEIIWERGAISAKEISLIAGETIGWNKNTTYTIIKKLEAKGFVHREDPGFICTPLVLQNQIQKAEVRSLVNKMFGGSRKALFSALLEDETLSEEEIIRIYGKRWDIEVFFKVCKSYLNLSRECNSLSYDAMTAHTTVVFTRYMMLSLESRESNDNRSLGELFLYFSDEMSDITWIQAFQMMLQIFRTMLTENTELSDEKIEELVDAFMNALPALLKTQLQAA